MSRKIYFAISVLAATVVLALAQNPALITGQWTIGGPMIQDRVQLNIQRSSSGNNMNSSSPVALSELKGLTRAQLESGAGMARFDIVRDAGTLHFEGFVQNGGGGGNFTFLPNPSFAGQMSSLDYLGLTDEKVFNMAMHDVSLAYIRDMNALGIRPESSDQLITMRIHNVTVEYVRNFKDLGYADLSPNKLVTMRIHGVTADFARELKSLGYNSVSTDQMVTMRIHGASTDFIKEVAALGYDHPGINQLVTMRIHNVTPEYIRKTRSLGMGNLPIEQLVSLRIHGIVE